MDKKMLSFLSAYNITMDSESSTSMSFQKVVLIVAIVAIILMLSFIGYMMYNADQNKPYPPPEGASQCPDTWTGTTAGTCTTNTAGTNIGNFIMENVFCAIGNTGDIGCNDGKGGVAKMAADCSGNWIRGNVANNLNSNNCYLLAKGWAGPAPRPLSYKTTTISKDIDWAKKYGITWDGFN
jgi:hypothetical protein